MAVLAKDFLRLAEALLNGPERTEMDLRTAAARAYYAVMHLVRMELGLSVDDSTHALIRDEMYRMPPARTPPFLGMAKRGGGVRITKSMGPSRSRMRERASPPRG